MLLQRETSVPNLIRSNVVVGYRMRVTTDQSCKTVRDNIGRKRQLHFIVVAVMIKQWRRGLMLVTRLALDILSMFCGGFMV